MYLTVKPTESYLPQEVWEDGWLVLEDGSKVNVQMSSRYSKEDQFMVGLGYKYKVQGSPAKYFKELAEVIGLTTSSSILSGGRVG